MCHPTESKVPEMDPHVEALSQEFDALAQVGNVTLQGHDNMVGLRERIESLGANENAKLSVLDESRRAALYPAASQVIAMQEHRRAITGSWES